jgi:hypothetical protein
MSFTRLRLVFVTAIVLSIFVAVGEAQGPRTKTTSLTIVVPPSTTKTVSPDTDNVTDAPNSTEAPDNETTSEPTGAPLNDTTTPPPTTPPNTDNVSTAPTEAPADATINDKSGDDEEGFSTGQVVVLIVVILVVLVIAVSVVVYFVRKGKSTAAAGPQGVPGRYATADDEMRQVN